MLFAPRWKEGIISKHNMHTYGLSKDYNLHIKKSDFPKISIGNGWDLILHELEGSNTFQRDNTLPSLKESTFYIQRENARDTTRLEGHHTF